MKVRVNWKINGGCRGECIDWAHTILVHLDHLKQDQTFGLMRGPGIGVLGHNLKCYGCIYNPVSYKDIGEEYMWQRLQLSCCRTRMERDSADVEQEIGEICQ